MTTHSRRLFAGCSLVPVCFSGFLCLPRWALAGLFLVLLNFNLIILLLWVLESKSLVLRRDVYRGVDQTKLNIQAFRQLIPNIHGLMVHRRGCGEVPMSSQRRRSFSI